MVESDLEGPWVKADHAFDVVAKGIPDGEQVFKVISSYDDIRFFVEKVPGYEPGDTLMLIAPLLVAHGADDGFLREVACSPENTRLIPGAKEAIRYIRGFDDFYLISTSYEQYVDSAASLLGVPKAKTFCTSFPIDDLKAGITKDDIELVKDWTKKIARMPSIEIDESGSIVDGCIKAKESLDEFFWEILPKTSFKRLMGMVRPVGGSRKYEALAAALEKQDKSLNEASVIGDSITDSVMLSKAMDAGALAMSFNGNRYSVPNSNVAVLSSSCWITAAMAEIWEKTGLDGVRDAVENWGLGKVKTLGSSGVLGNDLVENIVKIFSSSEPDPKVFWVESCDTERIIRESEAFRKGIRGAGIGELG